MNYDDMSDEDKQALMETMKNSSSSTPTMGSFSFNQDPSYASKNVSPDVSQSLTNNEFNIDSQNLARKAALEQFTNQGLTPEVQKIAEGMGGMGSVENIALKEAQPVVQAGLKAATPYVEDAASGLQKVFPKLQKYFQVGDKIFPAKHTAEAMKVHNALEKKGLVGSNQNLVGPFYNK